MKDRDLRSRQHRGAQTSLSDGVPVDFESWCARQTDRVRLGLGQQAQRIGRRRGEWRRGTEGEPVLEVRGQVQGSRYYRLALDQESPACTTSDTHSQGG